MVTLVKDFWVWDSGYDLGGIIVGSLDVDKYIIVPDDAKMAVLLIIHGLRQNMSFDAITDSLASQGMETDVQRFIDLLYYKNLCKKDNEVFDGKSDDVLSKNIDDLSSMSKNLFSIEIKKNLFRPEKMKLFPLLFFFLLSTVLIVTIMIFLLSYRADFYGLLADLEVARRFPFIAVPLLFVGMMASIFLSFAIHETGHVMMARAFGLYLRRIKFRLYLGFQLVISVQIPGLCTLRPRDRAFVAAAGPLANLILACIALTGFMVVPAGWGMIRIVLGSFALSNATVFLGNFNPLTPSDGYHFLSALVFKHPDIKSAVVQRIRMRRFPEMTIREKSYFALYILSMGFYFFIANSIIKTFSMWIFKTIDRPIISTGLAIACFVAANGYLVFKFVKFLSGKGKK